MDLTFSGEVFEWRGPAPYVFVRVPEDEALSIGDAATAVTYGWGMVPVTLRLGETTWTTSLWPKDGGYVVPLRAFVQQAEGFGLGDTVSLDLHVEV